MANYRLYCLDGAGHISMAEWLEADTDEQAIAIAREMRPEAHKCEVWLQNRLVSRLNSAGQFERVEC
jgi:hypothetical protein